LLRASCVRHWFVGHLSAVVLLKISSVRGNGFGLYVWGLIGESVQLDGVQPLGVNSILKKQLMC
jgi:hypothetical protein